MSTTDAVILSGCRTPIGAFGGALKDVTAVELATIAVREAVRRAGIRPDQVDEVILGCILQAGLGMNPARQATIKAGLPESVPATTVNKVCGSGLKAVMLAAQAIRCGDAEVIVAGGAESMSRAPYLLPGARWGERLGNGKVLDHMIHEGLTDAFHDIHMGITGREPGRPLRAHPRGAGRLRGGEPVPGRWPRSRDGRFKDEIVAGADRAEEGRREAVRHRRVSPRGHDRGIPRQAEAGLQEGRDGHGRERERAERRRGRAGRRLRRPAKGMAPACVRASCRTRPPAWTRR